MIINKQTDGLFENILPKFRTYSEKYKVEEIYDYDIKHKIYKNNELFSIKEQNQLEQSKNVFEKNVLLKDIVSEKLKLGINKIEHYYWIVKKWGGIPKFNKSIEFINDFLEELTIGQKPRLNPNHKNLLPLHAAYPHSPARLYKLAIRFSIVNFIIN